MRGVRKTTSLSDTEHMKLLYKKLALENKLAMNKTLTYDEVALMLWNDSPDNVPMSAMGVCKIEKRALEKLREGLRQRYGIDNIDDMLEPKYREIGKKVTASSQTL
jgi:hypothetical protein